MRRGRSLRSHGYVVSRGSLLVPLAALSAAFLLSACSGGSQPATSNSGSPASVPSMFPTGTPVVILGGNLSTYTPQGGAQKGRTLPGAKLEVHVTEGSLLFVVSIVPKTAVFSCVLHTLDLQNREVPIHVSVTSKYGSKTYHVRPSEPLSPGWYMLEYGGVGQYGLSLYRTGAH